MVVCFGLGILLICVFDQLTKFFVMQNIPLVFSTQVPDVTVIKGVLEFTHVHNTGAAWSIFEGNPYPLGVLSLLVAAAIAGYVIVKRPKSKLLVWALTFITGGAIGNVIDRFRFGYVIDFLKVDFLPFSFPIFNVADCFVTVGAVLFAVYVLFFSDKEEKTNGAKTSNSEG